MKDMLTRGHGLFQCNKLLGHFMFKQHALFAHNLDFINVLLKTQYAPMSSYGTPFKSNL